MDWEGILCRRHPQSVAPASTYLNGKIKIKLNLAARFFFYIFLVKLPEPGDSLTPLCLFAEEDPPNSSSQLEDVISYLCLSLSIFVATIFFF